MAEDPSDYEIVLHDVGLGRLRLNLVPKDVRDPEDQTAGLPLPQTVPDSHRSAHANWLQEVSWAADQAIDWWRTIADGFRDPGLSWADAARQAYQQWPSGPASSEYIVSVVRRHWLNCERLNAGLPTRAVIWPEDFLLGTLDPQVHHRVLLVLTAMPYWPIGLDENGNWC
jgi:hypothetical protein